MIIKNVKTKALKIEVNPNCISPFFAAIVKFITSIELCPQEIRVIPMRI